MTSNQVIELDLSAVQFEDLSDEMASSIQGGTDGPASEEGQQIAGVISDYFDQIHQGANLGESYEIFVTNLIDLVSDFDLENI